jgi:hypothetical protein
MFRIERLVFQSQDHQHHFHILRLDAHLNNMNPDRSLEWRYLGREFPLMTQYRKTLGSVQVEDDRHFATKIMMRDLGSKMDVRILQIVAR